MVKQPTNCLSVFDHFLGLALEGLVLVLGKLNLFHLIVQITLMLLIRKWLALFLMKKIFKILRLSFSSKQDFVCFTFSVLVKLRLKKLEP